MTIKIDKVKHFFYANIKQKNLAQKILCPIIEKIFIDTKRNSVQLKSGKI